MCFMLYAGTSDPIPRKMWNQDAPDISVQSLEGDEEQIKAHFSKPELQNVGSTSCCGCHFPYATFQNGGWPEIEFVSTIKEEKQKTSNRFNQEALVKLLTTINEDWIELYGVWAGDYTETPEAREELFVRDLLEPHFTFKERGFYKVVLKEPSLRKDSLR
jgi:hypothetical protein